MTERKDPFRTLDDPDPEPDPRPEPPLFSVKSDQIQAVSIGRNLGLCDGGYWVLPAKRPSWLRRLIVWLLLGWKWHV